MQRVLQALYQGDYDTAFEVMVRALTFAQGNEAAEAALLLAEAYTLYGEGGIEGVYRALEHGASAVPTLQEDPLFRALLAEARALEGAPEDQIRPLLEPSEDARVRFHQAQTLLYLGVPEESITLLSQDLELPPFLAWRAQNLLGKAHERMGQPAQAAEAYRRAAELSVGMERYWNLLDAGAMFVEAGQGQEALEVLEEAVSYLSEAEGLDPSLEDPEDAATRYYLTARAQLLLGNPSLALEAIQRARLLEEAGAERAHGTPLVQGQALMQLGQYAEAMQAFHEAVERSEGTDRTYALHELGVAALDAGDLEQAESALRQVIRDPDYDYPGEALGDLAEVLYRQSRYSEAEEAARGALEEGALAAGHIILGHLAYDLLNFQEALKHYREAVAEAPEGSRDWITAQEMIVDTLAQLGYENPAEMLSRSHEVLPYLTEADEWHQTLTAYAERARGMLGGRTLN